MSTTEPTERARPATVAVAGGTGTGKTTITERIVGRFGRSRVAVIHQDHYYRDRSDVPPEQRDELNFDHPDAIEFDLLAEHLTRLIAGETIERPNYDFVTHTRTELTTTLSPAPLIIVEGILILHPPALRNLLDLKIYLHADPDAMMSRRAARDVAHRGRPADDSAIKPFERHVLPMHQRYVEPTRRWADLVIDTTHPTEAAIAQIIERISALMP